MGGSYIEFHKEHKEMTFLLVTFTFCSTSLQFLMYTHHFPLQRDERLASGFKSESFHVNTLDLQSDYQVSFNMEDGPSSTLIIEPVHSPSNPVIKTFRHYKLACPTTEVSTYSIYISLIGRLFSSMNQTCSSTAQ